jgi:multiple sugar transport system permease protein
MNALTRKRINGAFILLVLLPGAVMSLAPLIWMVLTSIKPMNEVFTYPPQLLPSRIDFSNYLRAMTAAPWGRFFINSIIFSLSVIFGQVTTSLFAGYAFAKMKFKFRNSLFLAYVGTMMVPTQVTIIPIYVLLSRLGWVDTYQGLIIPLFAHAFGVFLFRQFFSTIPDSLVESAFIDGASHWQIVRRIIMPLSTPIIATLSVFVFRSTWNEFFWPLIVTNSERMRTVQIGLSAFQDQYGQVLWAPMMAAAVIVSLPVLILFISAQRYFVEGISMTGIK